ncbi:PREDICTED: lipase member K-like [Nicrophorus vespilloides]|uniref:Lipase n=1 Tax=Nicrophorus vespilloides TaxID=110193 RepID=A0ABM1NIH8_NICVS|nr:PREDICTED: lipase member K-like [Nicrophorus vespilloides]
MFLYSNTILILIFSSILIRAQQNNVCKEFIQYMTKTDGCYYNPDQNTELPDIVKRMGYPVENYTVTTDDSYILTVFRIPRPGAKPVFVQHGISVSAICFTDTLNDSLAYVLYDAGYDVWLGNFRGNRYANKHVFLNTDTLAYWNFSFHEMGKYDLKSQLGLVYEETNQKIYYIGYSMGTTASYIYNILHPEESLQKLNIMVSLAPIAYLRNMSEIFESLAELWMPLEPEISTITHGVVQQRSEFSTFLTETLCLSNTITMFICQVFTQSFVGMDLEQLRAETLPIVSVQNPDAASTKTITHYAQFVNSKRFQYFDYGRTANTRIYGDPIAPLYDISNITIPIYLMHGENDQLATMSNVENFFKDLPESTKKNGKFLVPYKKFNHLDFISAKDQKSLLYDPLVNFLKNPIL